MAAEKAFVKPAVRNSADVAAPARGNELPANAQASRPRPVPGPLRASQVPVSGAATRRGGFSSPAVQRAHRGPKPLRPSRTPAGTAGIAARPSTVPARPVPDLLPGPGQPLADPVRQEMQARLGADFSGVRVHADSAARASAAEVGAGAYTSGDHVVIGDGGTDKHTLAHELTHVIQQRQGPVAGTDNGAGLRVSHPSDPFERAAESNAVRVMSGSAPRPQAASPGRSVRIDGSSTAASAAADAFATATARSPNGEPAAQVNRLAIPAGAPQSVSSMTVQRKGRSQDLPGVGGHTRVIKVIMAGSGNAGWLTRIQKEKGEKTPRPSQYDPTKKSVPIYHKNLEKQERTELSFAGPGGKGTTGGGGGVFDIGSNSIANLVNTVPGVVERIVEDISGGEGPEGPRNIVILIKAHSRGAVAASQVAKKLSVTYRERETVKIELVLFDPVPGPAHLVLDPAPSENVEIDLGSIPLSEFTLVYSIATGWGVFTPQIVLGANRIIISRQGHEAGIRSGFRYDGKIYKGSRLNSLPPGVFVDVNEKDKNTKELQPVEDIRAFQEKLRDEDALKPSSFGAGGPKLVPDQRRKEKIEKVLEEYFAAAERAAASAEANADVRS
jgi:Domain of unknown function (DUF4157)